jgi:type I restriction enzyme S subunit
MTLGELGDFSTSSVDKKRSATERPVRLLNYMDVYKNRYLDSSMRFMEVTATLQEVQKARVRKGDMFFTPSSETPDDIGHSAVYLDDAVDLLHSYHTVRYRLHDPDQIDLRFRARLANNESVLKHFSLLATGSTRYTLSLADFRSAPICLPPLAEQMSIAKVLNTLDTAVLETETIITKLKAVKQGLLHDLLTRGIDSNGELRPLQAEAPHLYKESPLGLIPKDWNFEMISNLTTSSVIGPFGSDLVASDYRTSGVPVVFVRDIKPNSLSWKSNVYVSIGKARSLAAHEVVPGDVLATKMGLPPCIAAVYPDSMPNGVVTADVVRLRPDPMRILPGWMSSFINARAVVKQVEQITAGVTRPKVTLRDVRNLYIAMPGLEEQRLLLERLDAIEARLREEEQGLQKLSAEKSGLMDDLLTGRVRVTALLAEAKQAKECA